MRSRLTLAALSATLLAATLDAATAQGLRPAQMRGLAATRTADYFRVCPGVRPGGGRIIVCLNAQAEKLSQPCFQALAERGLAFTAALRLCRPDFERFCPGAPAGMGRALSCLIENQERISPGCRDALSAHGFDGDGEEDAPPSGGAPPSRDELPWRRR